MLVTLSGMMTLVRLLQDGMLSPMLVTLLGMVTLVRLAAVIECVNPDAGDAVGNDDARQASAVSNATSRCW